MATFWNISPTLTKRSILLHCLDKALDVYSSYEKVVPTGDFNVQQSVCLLCLSVSLIHYFINMI